MQEKFIPLEDINTAKAFHAANLIANGVHISDVDRVIEDISKPEEFLLLTGRLARSTNGQINEEALMEVRTRLQYILSNPKTPEPTIKKVSGIIETLTGLNSANGNLGNNPITHP